MNRLNISELIAFLEDFQDTHYASCPCAERSEDGETIAVNFELRRLEKPKSGKLRYRIVSEHCKPSNDTTYFCLDDNWIAVNSRELLQLFEGLNKKQISDLFEDTISLLRHAISNDDSIEGAISIPAIY